mgnify:CR=1 FL=1
MVSEKSEYLPEQFSMFAKTDKFHNLMNFVYPIV